MNWSEYARVSALFARRIGSIPPTIWSPEGVLEYMKRSLAKAPPASGDQDIEREPQRRRDQEPMKDS